MNVHDRFKDFGKQHCWQYEVRLQNLAEDLKEANLTEEAAGQLRTSDFDFAYVDKTDKDQCAEIRRFIERHEWLGKLPNRPTERFTARLRGSQTLAGVVVMATPNAFSHMLGPENKGLEKLISRGASISWAPKNLGSWLIMKSIKWMVRNKDYRSFTAYSDPEAKELGTIYQACNFIYLGQTSGTSKQYFDPNNEKAGWFSDRDFRKKSKYKKYVENIGTDELQWMVGCSWIETKKAVSEKEKIKEWMKKHMKKYSPNWDIIPAEIKTKIKAEEKKYRDSCLSRPVPSKHKYCYILGRTKSETKELHNLFKELNPKLYNLSYPRERGR